MFNARRSCGLSTNTVLGLSLSISSAFPFFESHLRARQRANAEVLYTCTRYVHILAAVAASAKQFLIRGDGFLKLGAAKSCLEETCGLQETEAAGEEGIARVPGGGLLLVCLPTQPATLRQLRLLHINELTSVESRLYAEFVIKCTYRYHYEYYNTCLTHFLAFKTRCSGGGR